MSQIHRIDIKASRQVKLTRVYSRVAKLTEEDGKTIILLKAGWIFPGGRSDQAFDSLSDAMRGIHLSGKGTPAPSVARPLAYMDYATAEERIAALMEVGK